MSDSYLYPQTTRCQIGRGCKHASFSLSPLLIITMSSSAQAAANGDDAKTLTATTATTPDQSVQSAHGTRAVTSASAFTFTGWVKMRALDLATMTALGCVLPSFTRVGQTDKIS